MSKIGCFGRKQATPQASYACFLSSQPAVLSLCMAMRMIRFLLILVLPGIFCPPAFTAGKPLAIAAAPNHESRITHNASCIFLIVWNGMRPDFVSEKTCPTLFRLGLQGVIFQNHHSVYPSATEVNGTVLSTGVWPVH